MKYGFLFSLFLLINSFACDTATRTEELSHFELLDSIINRIEENLVPLEREIQELARFSVSMFEKRDSLIKAVDREKYIRDENDWFYNPNEEKEASTVFISFQTANMKKSIEEVYITEPMDRAFQQILSRHPMVAQVYYNSGSQFSRLYPPYDLANTIDPEIDVTAFNFYYLADELRNPDKKHVWVEETYIDPAGRGWILSLIHPVYYQDELKGVLGIDITLVDIMEYLLERFEKNLLIIDSQGTIVAGTTKAIEALSMPPLKNHTYLQTITSDNFRREDFNLFKSKSKDVRRMASKFLYEKENTYELEMSGLNYFAYCRQMNVVNWYLLDLHD
jgi:hypothetical protein